MVQHSHQGHVNNVTRRKVWDVPRVQKTNEDVRLEYLFK